MSRRILIVSVSIALGSWPPAAQSVNAWDSLSEVLSEAQEAAGRNPEALASVDRALGLLSKDASLNPNLRERLERGLRERRTRLTQPESDPKSSGLRRHPGASE